jgi:hypothetical protein
MVSFSPCASQASKFSDLSGAVSIAILEGGNTRKHGSYTFAKTSLRPDLPPFQLFIRVLGLCENRFSTFSENPLTQSL